MDIWKHSLLSQKKFGGQPEDYFGIHKFLDASKMFYFHLKHRALLHNTYGIELSTELFGDYIKNSDGITVLVRDIAATHLQEDLNGKVPTLSEWFKDQQGLEEKLPEIPIYEEKDVNEFIWLPFLRSGLRSTLIITCSNFGVYLMQQFFDVNICMRHAETLVPNYEVGIYLEEFTFTESWQHTPNREDLALLKQKNYGNKQSPEAKTKFQELPSST